MHDGSAILVEEMKKDTTDEQRLGFIFNICKFEMSEPRLPIVTSCLLDKYGSFEVDG